MQVSVRPCEGKDRIVVIEVLCPGADTDEEAQNMVRYMFSKLPETSLPMRGVKIYAS